MWYRFLHCSRLGLNRHYVIWYAVVKFVGVCVCVRAHQQQPKQRQLNERVSGWALLLIVWQRARLCNGAYLTYRYGSVPPQLNSTFFSYKILFRFYFVHCFLLYHFNGRRSKVEQAMAGKSWMQLSFIYRPIAGWFFTIAVVLYAAVMLATRNKSKNQNDIVYIILY